MMLNLRHISSDRLVAEQTQIPHPKEQFEFSLTFISAPQHLSLQSTKNEACFRKVLE